jgi:RNA polymerase sigma-70 factor (ECF subfamily)
MNSSSEFADYSDAELIKLVGECQLPAFEALYERHAEAVYSLVIKITRKASIADTVLHEIFWQIWCEPSTLAHEENLMAYFCRVARCTSLQQLRLRNTHTQLS